MDHISTLELKVSGDSSAGRRWNMDFVSGDEAVIGIFNFPPPLVTDNPDVQSVLRRAGILSTGNNAGRHANQNEDDEDRNNSPRDFDLITSINLWRFLEGVVADFAAETEDRIND